MGSSSSRLGSRPSRPRLHRRFSSLICGGSTSRAPPEIEDCPPALLVNTAEHNYPVNVEQSSTKESLLTSNSWPVFTSFRTETGTTSEGSSAARDDRTSINGLSNADTSNRGKCLSESKELIPPHLVNDEYSQVDPYWERESNRAGASFKDLHPLDPVSASARANMDAVNDVHNSMDRNRSHSGAGFTHSNNLHVSECGGSYSDVASAENHVSGVMAIGSSVSVPAVTDPPVNLNSHGDESIQGVTPSGLGIVVSDRSDRSDREQGQRDGSVLHVDLVSISSNILSSTTAEVSNREARRNSRRVFWDAFSRRSSRRHSDSPTIVFSADDTDDLGSHDRWLLDFSGDFFEDGIGGDSGYLGSRIHSLHERRWHARSEIWERIRGGVDENSRQTTCPTGRHPDGMCTCDSFLMAEESSARASISRIVMLAEALFEVLDEIHRQPVSLSLSMVSLPAPESVVDSFPLKNHQKANTAENGEDVVQCYICLAEYEEGDKIRVLPCHHEYHMSCVDKWLKEIHGVCPLCRGDVREGLTSSSASNPEEAISL